MARVLQEENVVYIGCRSLPYVFSVCSVALVFPKRGKW